MPDSVHPEPRVISRRRVLGAAVAAAARPAHAAAMIAGAERWQMDLRGGDGGPLRLSLADLRRLGEGTVVVVLECGGSGAVRNVTWTGVPLQAVLDHARLPPHAFAIVATGEDGHRRAISLRDVSATGALLAWAMDGVPLGRESGGPVRLLVPGWAGEASVKSLAALEVVERLPAVSGPADPGDRRLRPLREMPPRAVIVAPAPGSVVHAGARILTGYAWSGYAPVASVAVTIDGGATWREAEIGERVSPRAWVRFAIGWEARPGSAVLAARATDALGLTQPLRRPGHARGFIHNAVVAVPVRVTG